MKKVAVFSTKEYDKNFLMQSWHARKPSDQLHDFEFKFFEPTLDQTTARLAEGFDGVCVFVNDNLDREVLTLLKDGGTRMIALRCAGYNNVDLEATEELGIRVFRVPGYSPNAVAEHAVALILGLNRKIHRAYNRVREGNFSLDGLMGFDLVGKTVGVIGTGKIGKTFAKIISGFGCTVLAYDPFPPKESDEWLQYTDLETLFRESDIISLHCPLLDSTAYIVNDESISRMKKGVMIINTSRGGLVDTEALINHLKKGHIGSVGLDVYEEESELFFHDHSRKIIQDDIFMRLTTFPNVLITGHQAFFTQEAVDCIAETTVRNIQNGFSAQPTSENSVLRTS